MPQPELDRLSVRLTTSIGDRDRNRKPFAERANENVPGIENDPRHVEGSGSASLFHGQDRPSRSRSCWARSASVCWAPEAEAVEVELTWFWPRKEKSGITGVVWGG